jgi:CheY-like chemotaxis protein
VVYANLAPGRYRFEVRALSADGGTSPTPATLSFTVLRPLWQRWWAITMAVLTLAALAYALHRLRVARAVHPERVRTRIATDLHDDIGSSLSYVALVSDVLHGRADPEERDRGPGGSAETVPRIVRVAIVEDHRDLREGLRVLIDGTPGYRCLGAFRTMEEALPRIAADTPGVVLADIGLPGMSVIEGVKILLERHPELQLLMLTVYDDDRFFEALCAGATGYLLKKTPPGRILESLNEAVAGGSPMSPEVARRAIVLFREVRPP